jgi:hypothetical protein
MQQYCNLYSGYWIINLNAKLHYKFNQCGIFNLNLNLKLHYKFKDHHIPNLKHMLELYNKFKVCSNYNLI